MKLAFLVLFTLFTLLIFSQEKTRRIPITTKEGTKAIVEVDNRHKKIKPQKEVRYTWYKAKSILTTQGAYQGDLLHGVYQENYANKQLKVQGIYRYGLKNGTWRYWDETGKLVKEENWKNGTLNIPKPKVIKVKKTKEQKPKKDKNNKEAKSAENTTPNKKK